MVMAARYGLYNVLLMLVALLCRGHALHDYPGQSAPTRDEAHAVIRGEHTPSRQVMFRDTVSNSDLEDPDSEGNPSEREPPTNWGSGNSPYSTSMNDPSSSYSPYLPPVLEEPSSSFSEGKAVFPDN